MLSELTVATSVTLLRWTRQPRLAVWSGIIRTRSSSGRVSYRASTPARTCPAHPDRNGADLAHRSVVLPQQAALRRSGHLRPSPQPRADRPRPHASRSSPASPTPTSTRGSSLTKVPSLDLYRDPDPFRTPRPSEIRDRIDVEEVLTMWTAGLPRAQDVQQARGAAAARPASRTSTSSTTTRCSATACSTSRRWACPLITSIHHPITFDRRIDLAAATRPWQQAHPAALVRLPADAGQGGPADGEILTVSESSRHDIVKDFGVDDARIQVIPLGVDEVFCPPTTPRVPGPDRRDGQRRRPDEGHRHAARGVRQAAHRARRRAAPRHQADARRPHRAADRPARHRRARDASSTASATPSSSR